MNRANFVPASKLETLEQLANFLGIALPELLYLSKNANAYYRPNAPRTKPDGTKRQTYRVLKRLAAVQAKLNSLILSQISYPSYLQGGIKDTTNKRDYARDAGLHISGVTLLKEDIANFFPAIRAHLVFEIFSEFLGLRTDVAQALTNITTYRGFVPQGAATSSYLANLVFWDCEPQLEHELRARGYVYSRLTDDITVSANWCLTQDQLREVTELIYPMFFDKGFSPKRSKRHVIRAGNGIQVHRLNLGAGRPTLQRGTRMKIRAAVREYEQLAKEGANSAELEELYLSVRGRLALWERFHPSQARKYIGRLEAAQRLRW